MLRVLGDVVVDGRDPIGSRAQRVVLAALALDRGTTVSTDRLIELIWGGQQPEHPVASLHNHLSRLRRTLPDGIGPVATGAGYRLDVADDDLDLARFEAAFEQACALAPTERLDLVDGAIALWRGRPFEELDDPRAAAEAVRLEEILHALGELRDESLLALGRVHEAIAALENRRAVDPLRERTVELLMRAHVAAGRRIDALGVYRALRTQLAEELGLDPSPALQDLEAAILTDRLVVERTPLPAPVGSEPPATRLAVPASSFLGRADELSAVRQTLAEHRIVTLTGPGGVGKTRLSVHAAAAAGTAFGGVTIVELAQLHDPARLAEVVAGALELHPRGEVSDARRVIDALAGRRHLLVLDNCEHLLLAAAEFVDDAVRGVPGLRVLATSREPLNIDGERILRIEPLRPEVEAVELFADRAAAVVPGFVIDETNRSRVEHVCRSLDGLPLAIELAAARLATMSLDDIEAGLERRFAVFARGRRTADARHRSLGALVEWSVRGLDDELRSVFARTSAFAGSFTATAAAEVCGIPHDVVADRLADLVECSLLVTRGHDRSPVRYAYLETVRAYGRTLLADEPTAADVEARHAEWVLASVEEMRAALGTPAERQAVEQVIGALAELRLAHRRFVASGDADRSLRMARGLHRIALFRMQAEMFAWISESAERFGDRDHPAAEDVLAAAATGAWQAGDLTGARRYAEWAHRVAARSAWPGTGHGAAAAMADVVGFGGDQERAVALFDQAVAAARAGGDRLATICDLADLAMLVGYGGDAPGVHRLIGEARSLLGEGSTAVHAWVDYALGEALADAEPVVALAALERALASAHATSARFITGVAGLTRVGLQVRGGGCRAAIPGLVDLMVEWRDSGAEVQQAITLRTVVEVLVRLDRLEEAAVVLGAVLASASPAEASGADLARLEQARVRIERDVPDAADRMERGRVAGTEAIVGAALDCLRTLLEPEPTPAAAR